MSSTIKRTEVVELDDATHEIEAISIGRVIALCVRHAELYKMFQADEIKLDALAEMSDNAVFDIVDAALKRPIGTARREGFDPVDAALIALTAVELTIPSSQKKMEQMARAVGRAVAKVNALATDGVGSSTS